MTEESIDPSDTESTTGCANQMEEFFLVKLEKVTKLWSRKLFSEGTSSKQLSEEMSEIFHSFAKKKMLCARKDT